MSIEPPIICPNCTHEEARDAFRIFGCPPANGVSIQLNLAELPMRWTITVTSAFVGYKAMAEAALKSGRFGVSKK